MAENNDSPLLITLDNAWDNSKTKKFAQKDNSAIVDIHAVLLEIEKDEYISDLHLAANEYISYRRNWDIIKQFDAPKLTTEAIELILRVLMEKTPENFSKFWSDKDMDFSYISKSQVSYRVNAYLKRWKLAISMRKIYKTAKEIKDLMYEDVANTIISKILNQKSWLFLVTWPSGSGKSTTLVSCLEYLNHTRQEHIITIEDPIEYVFTPDKALISQRELENDTWSFKNALRATLRQDPDIIFVGEIRDKETAEAALQLAETWHLVFSTLHTSDAPTTISRFISFFSPDIQDNIADRLASVLLWVHSQYLLKTADGKSRIGLFELMLNTLSIKNNIRRREIKQLQSIIESSTQQGMITRKQYAQRLLDQSLINPESVNWLWEEAKENEENEE